MCPMITISTIKVNIIQRGPYISFGEKEEERLLPSYMAGFNSTGYSSGLKGQSASFSFLVMMTVVVSNM